MQALPDKQLFRREIALILLIKALLIYSLWYACFSQPVDKTLTGEQIATTLFGLPATNPTNTQTAKK